MRQGVREAANRAQSAARLVFSSREVRFARLVVTVALGVLTLVYAAIGADAIAIFAQAPYPTAAEWSQLNYVFRTQLPWTFLLPVAEWVLLGDMLWIVLWAFRVFLMLPKSDKGVK